MGNSLPAAKSARPSDDRRKIQRVIKERGLCGLANDTKWDKLITEMRVRRDWRPSYRWKCVDGPPSGWDCEWFYHLPFPFISVEWFDVTFLQESKNYRLLPATVTDHSPWLETTLQQIGLEHQKGSVMIRIFGYSPRDLALFDR